MMLIIIMSLGGTPLGRHYLADATCLIGPRLFSTAFRLIRLIEFAALLFAAFGESVC